MTHPASRPLLVAPAGDWPCLRAAVANGADAVYFGLPRFNARMRAENFSREELPEILDFLHAHGVKGFVALNVLIFTEELHEATEELRWCWECGADAVILQDAGLAAASKEMFPSLEIHASTQMTITSAEGLAFARSLGIHHAVLARELSVEEIASLTRSAPDFTTEVFVHGSLCVAFSGQCLTSESLGQRSANRGECAQACRLPYDLILDGKPLPLGDRRYLLSPHDLAGIDALPALLAAGVGAFKIEGRLKAPEYVAAVTAIYRKALDAALASRPAPLASPEDRFRLEMAFSRGLSSGWLQGVNHRLLVSARFGKKRGPLAGSISRIGPDWVEIAGSLPLFPGDGLAFDTGGNTDREQGGRIFSVKGNRIKFEPGKIRFHLLKKGNLVWKTDDPKLTKELRRSWAGNLPSRQEGKPPVFFEATGKPGYPLSVSASVPHLGLTASAQSASSLLPAANQPLSPERFSENFSKAQNNPFRPVVARWEVSPPCFLPIAEINELRRSLLDSLRSLQQVEQSHRSPAISLDDLLLRMAPPQKKQTAFPPLLLCLCRSMEQAFAALESGANSLTLDFEDVRRYRPAIAELKTSFPSASLFVAAPRILKPKESGFLAPLRDAAPDGILARNLATIEFFRSSQLPLIGDFSLNVANPLSAATFLRSGLSRLTLSYDLTAEQIFPLARAFPPGSFEITIHQHMPMFHMEHCVFAAFLSDGKDFRDCGRPCEKHAVHLRDRVGESHPLRADSACRNTLFRAASQTGASFYDPLFASGIRHFRIELLEESSEKTKKIVAAYTSLLQGDLSGESLWQTLKSENQLGITKGTLDGKAM